MIAHPKLFRGFLLSAVLLALSDKGQAQFTYKTNNGAITITGYTGSGGNVTIPDTINELPVAVIGHDAFSRNTNVTSVVIPNSVIVVEGNITTGGARPSLGAFEACYGLTNVAIGNGVANMGSRAFGSCTNLIAITVDINNSAFSSVAGVLFDKAQMTLLQYPARRTGECYTIQDSVTKVAADAFENCINLNSVTIPDSVTNMGPAAFRYCFNLNTVTIGNGVTIIDRDAFSSCTSLTNARIPNSVKSISRDAFYNCTNLTSITIGNGVIGISPAAFACCYGLTGIYFMGNAPYLIPSSIYVGAFYGDTATVYYLPATTGWGTNYGGLPTAFWLPQAQPSGASFRVQTNQFGFNIAWASGIAVVVEACTNLTNPVWQAVQTNTLTAGAAYFSDPQWTNYPGRFYRVRWP